MTTSLKGATKTMNNIQKENRQGATCGGQTDVTRVIVKGWKKTGRSQFKTIPRRWGTNQVEFLTPHSQSILNSIKLYFFSAKTEKGGDGKKTEERTITRDLQ